MVYIVLLYNLPHCATYNAACEELSWGDGEHRCRLGFSRDEGLPAGEGEEANGTKGEGVDYDRTRPGIARSALFETEDEEDGAREGESNAGVVNVAQCLGRNRKRA